MPDFSGVYLSVRPETEFASLEGAFSGLALNEESYDSRN